MHGSPLSILRWAHPQRWAALLVLALLAPWLVAAPPPAEAVIPTEPAMDAGESHSLGLRRAR